MIKYLVENDSIYKVKVDEETPHFIYYSYKSYGVQVGRTIPKESEQHRIFDSLGSAKLYLLDRFYKQIELLKHDIEAIEEKKDKMIDGG